MITDKDFILAAALIKCKVAAIKAVYEAETAGRGYLVDGRVKILFEGHRFWKQLKKNGFDPAKVIAENPTFRNVLYQVWDKKQYKGGSAEWERLSLAMQLCAKIGAEKELALKSASYGSFQIMGENCQSCGYATAHEMIAAYNNGGEGEQLNSFVRFVKSNHLDDELRDENWFKFADGYNGSASRLNGYGAKITRLFKKYSAVGV